MRQAHVEVDLLTTKGCFTNFCCLSQSKRIPTTFWPTFVNVCYYFEIIFMQIVSVKDAFRGVLIRDFVHAKVALVLQTPVIHALGVVLQDPVLYPDPTK